MIGVVLVTHTDYGSRLLKAAEYIVGEQENCRAVSVDTTHEVDQTIAAMKEAVKESDTGDGVMILTDMFGGTPTNLALSLLGTQKLEVITGVNLPMLIKVLGGREMSLSKLASEAQKAGRSGIVVAGEVLRSKVAGD